MKKIFTKFFALIGIMLIGGGSSAWAEEQTASFSLVSFTAGNPAEITSTDNTNVSLSIGRSDNTSNVSADSKNRGFRVQASRFFTITVPEGKYITQVDFTSNSQGNPSKNDGEGNVGIWSVTGQTSAWKLGGKKDTYTWKNGGTNFSSPMTFAQTGDGDAYIAAVKVYYDEIPEIENEAPTIKTQPTNKTTVTGVATTLSLAAEGVPTPEYQWYSCEDNQKTNAQKIDGATSNNYNFETNVAGTYYFYAVASNEEGDATSDVVTVTVNQSYTMTFSKDNEDIIGTMPSAIRTNGELKVTTPKNYSLYLTGKTFTHWTDGENNYLPNTEYTLSSNVTVTPVFENNTVALDNLVSATTVNFIKSTSVAATYQSSNKNAVVEQLTASGKTIDVALVVQNGKFDLQPANSRAQTNLNTVVSIPVVDGAIVKIGIYDNNSTKTWNCSINNESVESYLTETSNSNVKDMKYTYHGEAKSIDYVVNANNMYANNIDVVYPGKYEASSLFSMKTAATGNVSVENGADHVAIPDAAKLTVNGGSVTVSNGQSSAKNLVTSAGFSQTNGNTFFTVTLDSPLQAGDVITATMSQAGRGLKFATTDGYSSDYPGEAAEGTAFSYTVTAEDGICGETTFNVFRATGNTTTFNNFKITRPAAETVEITSAGYATFSAPVALNLDYMTGGAAYVATAANGETVTIEPASGIVPANTGLIIKGNGTCSIPVSAEAGVAPAKNLLVAVTADNTQIAAGNYVLGVDEGEVKFLLVEGVKPTLNAGKSYLAIQAQGRALRFVEGEANGINDVNVEAVAAPAKYIVNGKLVIEKAGKMFNAAGAQIK